ncbi:MAG: SDR family oxidoreductase [Acidobacteria bacterium]|nr:SDR family oxidoreductase [Acidobacteriota bacterium]
MELHDEVALITGGSRGIGRAIALKFAQHGARVGIAARAAADLQSVGEEIRGLGREVLTLPCDVSDEAAVREMVERAEAHFGKIDVLVNNAGYFPTLSPAQAMPESEWERTLRLNLTSAFSVSRKVLPGMQARRHGSIVMISSTGAIGAYPYGSPYAAAKAGLLGLTRALAAEGGPYGVRVNAICPGVIPDTGMHEKVGSEVERMSGQSPAERVAAAQNATLLRRLPTPQDVADVALFLASAQSALITGQTLYVDGGQFFT